MNHQPLATKSNGTMDPSRRAREWLRRCARINDPRPALSAAVVVAHPDDEVIGAGGLIPNLQGATFVHVTDGSPRDLRDATAAGFQTGEEYAEARRKELATALDLAGISMEQTRRLGYIDQEASFHLVDLAHRLAKMWFDARPEIVITHPYEGGHPDHDATAFAVHAACRLLSDRMTPPALIEMTSYHGRDGIMVSFEFLPNDGGDVITVVLSEARRGLKRRMFEAYVTQQKVLSAFPIELERFRLAPGYDFTRPPHEGPLYYERFDWGMTGTRWRSLARQALEALQIGDVI